MSNVITSIGVEFYVGYSENRNSRPTWEQYQKLPNIVECSELDMKPDAITMKSYDSLDFIPYIADSVDSGGTHFLTANVTKHQDTERIWDEMVKKYQEGNFIWLAIYVPKIEESTYIPICPVKTGTHTIKQQSIITVNLYYTIIDQVKFDESIRPAWGKKWNYITSFNGGQQLGDQDTIKLDDINKLFNNLFFMKGK